MGLSAFGRALVLASNLTPAGAPTSRWYGVNVRASYLFLDQSEQSKFYLSPGFYLWGMLQSQNSSNLKYGVDSLSGPQVVISGRFKTGTGRTYGGYIKFATRSISPARTTNLRQARSTRSETWLVKESGVSARTSPAPHSEGRPSKNLRFYPIT